jgi:hypothetical protein
MSEQELFKRRYPIGVFQIQENMTEADVAQALSALRLLPRQMRTAVQNLTKEKIDTPYRPNGWTVRQVVHHTADSHINGLIRLKWALTEENPTIKAYDEQLWAELSDTKLPIEISLHLLESVHARWVAIAEKLAPADFSKTFYHPNSKITWSLAAHCAHYAWHGQHHLAHIGLVAEAE